MARQTLDTVAKLVAKAQSTSSEAEALALVERCYELLAQIVNAHDEVNPTTGTRRRERRRLRDRRRRPAPEGGNERSGPRRVVVEEAADDPVARYRRAAAGAGRAARRGLDVSL